LKNFYFLKQFCVSNIFENPVLPLFHHYKPQKINRKTDNKTGEKPRQRAAFKD